MSEGQPTRFFVNGIVALALLFGLTLMMTPRPEVNYLRAMIAVGLGIVLIKMLIRYYRPHWLPDRLRGKGPR